MDGRTGGRPYGMRSNPRSCVIRPPDLLYCPTTVHFTHECPPLECNLPHSGAVARILPPQIRTIRLIAVLLSLQRGHNVWDDPVWGGSMGDLCENVWKTSHSLGVSYVV